MFIFFLCLFLPFGIVLLFFYMDAKRTEKEVEKLMNDPKVIQIAQFISQAEERPKYIILLRSKEYLDAVDIVFGPYYDKYNLINEYRYSGNFAYRKVPDELTVPVEKYHYYALMRALADMLDYWTFTKSQDGWNSSYHPGDDYMYSNALVYLSPVKHRRGE